MRLFRRKRGTPAPAPAVDAVIAERRKFAAEGKIHRHPRPWEKCNICWRGQCYWPDCGNDAEGEA